MRQSTKNVIRCFCSRKPLLAMYGLDEKGQIYVHIKAYKGRRIFVEVLFTKGEIEMRCRDCFRWYRLVIKDNKPKLIEATEPDSVSSQAVTDHV